MGLPEQIRMKEMSVSHFSSDDDADINSEVEPGPVSFNTEVPEPNYEF
jgi:hypothetical protein